MKKIVFLIVTMAALCGANAQDTIYTRVPPGNYFTDVWPTSYTNGGTDTFHCEFLWHCVDRNVNAQAFYKYTKDSLVIYGIAASLLAEKDYPGFFAVYQDNSYDSVYDYLRIFEAGPTQPIPVGERLKVHMHVTPISYYIDFDAYPTYSDYNPKWPAYPMYECYFHTPVTVADSFYIGRECHACRNVPGFLGTTMPIMLLRTYPSRYDTAAPVYQYSCHNMYSPGFGVVDTTYDSIYFHWFYNKMQYEANTRIPLLFPIITPPDTSSLSRDTTNVTHDTTTVGDTVIVCDTTIVCDTLIVNGDTIINYDTIITYDTLLAINETGLLGRLTGVMPNPAAETAKVVSSFGISRIEAYNMAGERVHEVRVPDGSLSATLDLRRLPAGAYILRIHTPQGVATKKLTVRR